MSTRGWDARLALGMHHGQPHRVVAATLRFHLSMNSAKVTPYPWSKLQKPRGSSHLPAGTALFLSNSIIRDAVSGPIALTTATSNDTAHNKAFNLRAQSLRRHRTLKNHKIRHEACNMRAGYGCTIERILHLVSQPYQPRAGTEARLTVAVSDPIQSNVTTTQGG